MPRTHDMTLLGLVCAMFLTNLILIGLLVVYATKVTNNDYRYELLKEDYTRMILQNEREHDVELGRVHEQMSNLQFTMDRRFGLIDDREFLRKQQAKE